MSMSSSSDHPSYCSCDQSTTTPHRADLGLGDREESVAPENAYAIPVYDNRPPMHDSPQEPSAQCIPISVDNIRFSDSARPQRLAVASCAPGVQGACSD